MTEPITITIREGNQGLDIAEALFCGRSFSASSRNGVSMKLARALVEGGAHDAPVEARGTDGRLRFTSPSLHRLARWTVEESDRGIRQRRWKPAPMGGERGQDAATGSPPPAAATERRKAA